MSVAGWLPTDTVIGFAGLAWMWNILAAFHPGLYLVIIVGGVVWLLAGALRERGGLLDVGVYLALALVLFGFFGAQAVPVNQGPSFAQRHGATVVPGANEPLVEASGVRAPRGFLLITNTLQEMVDRLLPAINTDFVRNPFALFAATNAMMLGGFDDDPALRARLADFSEQCWSPAQAEFLNDIKRPPTPAEIREIATPVSTNLERYYGRRDYLAPGQDGQSPTRCDAVWTPLKRDIEAYVQTHGNWGTWLSAKLRHLKADPDEWLRQELLLYRAKYQPAHTPMSGATGQPVSGVFGRGILGGLAYLLNWGVAAQTMELIRYAASPALGYVTAILYVAFPFVLAAALLPGGAGRLVRYFALLGSVKGWPLVWAMVDRIYEAVLQVWPLTELATGGFRPPMALNMVTALMYILGPVAFSAALGIAGGSLARGLGGFTTMRLPLFLIRK